MAKAVTSRIRPSLADANARAPEALLYPPHPVGLEDGVDRLMRRRRDGVLATEGDDLAGEPIELEAVARLEIVCHGRLIGGGKLATQRSSSAAKSGGNSTPAARPTAIVSCISL